jgi:hypothetical protein
MIFHRVKKTEKDLEKLFQEPLGGSDQSFRILFLELDLKVFYQKD